MIQDGDDVQPLPGKAKEHDGKQLSIKKHDVVKIKRVNNLRCCWER